MIQLIE